MVIFWGRKRKTHRLGYAVIHCIACHRPQWALVREALDVAHFMLFLTDRGRRIAIEFRCTNCKAIFAAPPENPKPQNLRRSPDDEPLDAIDDVEDWPINCIGLIAIEDLHPDERINAMLLNAEALNYMILATVEESISTSVTSIIILLSALTLFVAALLIHDSLTNPLSTTPLWIGLLIAALDILLWLWTLQRVIHGRRIQADRNGLKHFARSVAPLNPTRAEIEEVCRCAEELGIELSAVPAQRIWDAVLRESSRH